MINDPILTGIDNPHTTDFVFDRPHGIGRWFITCFTAPFLIMTREGLEIGEAGDCLVHDPQPPQYHTSVPDAEAGFRNDYVFSVRDWIGDRVKDLRIPLNQRIPTGRPTALRPYIRAIIREGHHHGPLAHEFIDLHIHGMLLEIARAHRESTEIPAAVHAHRHELLEVRRHMYQRLAHPWTVPELADLIGLKRNRFTSLYRQSFGVTPHRDLLQARLREAASRLLTSDETVTDIAEACGFATIQYFSRAFRDHYQCPPTAFSRRG